VPGSSSLTVLLC